MSNRVFRVVALSAFLLAVACQSSQDAGEPDPGALQKQEAASKLEVAPPPASPSSAKEEAPGGATGTPTAITQKPTASLKDVRLRKEFSKVRPPLGYSPAPASKVLPALRGKPELAVPSPAIGANPAKVTVLAFFDFECQNSKRAFVTIRQIAKAFPTELRLVFKFSPRTKNGTDAALWAIAAARKGKFWEVAEQLFVRQAELGDGLYEELGRKILQVDTKDVKALIASAEAEDRLALDMADGQRMGAKGTPALYFNGVLVLGARPIGKYDGVVKQELAKANLFMRNFNIPLEEVSARLTPRNLGQTR